MNRILRPGIRRAPLLGVAALAAGVAVAIWLAASSGTQTATGATDPEFAVLNTPQVASRDVPAHLSPSISSLAGDTTGIRLVHEEAGVKAYLSPARNGAQELICQILVLREGTPQETVASGCAERSFVVTHGSTLVYQDRSEPRWVVATLPDGYDSVAAGAGTVTVKGNTAVFRSPEGETSATARGAGHPDIAVTIR